MWDWNWVWSSIYINKRIYPKLASHFTEGCVRRVRKRNRYRIRFLHTMQTSLLFLLLLMPRSKHVWKRRIILGGRWLSGNCIVIISATWYDGEETYLFLLVVGSMPIWSCSLVVVYCLFKNDSSSAFYLAWPLNMLCLYLSWCYYSTHVKF